MTLTEILSRGTSQIQIMLLLGENDLDYWYGLIYLNYTLDHYNFYYTLHWSIIAIFYFGIGLLDYDCYLYIKLSLFYLFYLYVFIYLI